MGESRGALKVMVEKPEHLDDPSEYGSGILKYMLKKLDRGFGLDWSGSGYG
jgi:hypothetical protein